MHRSYSDLEYYRLLHRHPVGMSAVSYSLTMQMVSDSRQLHMATVLVQQQQADQQPLLANLLSICVHRANLMELVEHS
jgi:hypothetical protein